MRFNKLDKPFQFDAFTGTATLPPPKKAAYKRIKNEIKKEYSPPDYIGQNVYIRPSYIVSLPEYSYQPRELSQAFINNMLNLKKNKHKGNVSHKADKKIRSVINWLCLSAEPKRVYHKAKNSWFTFKINFITLTLPDTDKPISDFDFKTKLLNPFLVWARKYLGLRNYVWKIEFQKNGKLHVHITSDTFLHYKKIRKEWNHLLGANGYLIKFSRDNGHADPNSTDVHSVRKITNIAGYIAKYMGKSDLQLSKVRGRIWGCNYELSRALDCKVFIDRDACHKHMYPLMRSNIKWEKMLHVDLDTGVIRERGEIFFPTARDWISSIDGVIKQLFDEKILAIRNIAHDGQLFRDLLQV